MPLIWCRGRRWKQNGVRRKAPAWGLGDRGGCRWSHESHHESHHVKIWLNEAAQLGIWNRILIFPNLIKDCERCFLDVGRGTIVAYDIGSNSSYFELVKNARKKTPPTLWKSLFSPKKTTKLKFSNQQKWTSNKKKIGNSTWEPPGDSSRDLFIP